LFRKLKNIIINMNQTNSTNAEPVHSPNKLKINYLYHALVVIIFTIGILIGSFLYYYSLKYIVINALSILAINGTLLILALFQKIDYSKRLFIINLVVANLLVSYYPFGQGMIIIMIIIFAQRLLKLL